MKNNAKNILGALTLSCIVFAGCGRAIKPSSNITKEKRPLTDFSGIEASNAFTVYVNITDHEGIELEANENLHEYIIIEKAGDKLVIRLQDHIHIMGHPVLNVNVSAKKLNDFMASGASNFILQDTLKTDDIKIKLSGASHFNGPLETKNLGAELSGAASLDLTGTSEFFELKESGASSAGGFDFVCKNLKTHFSGASKARLTVNEKLAVEASGASELTYKGTAMVISQDLSGASSLHKR